VLKLIFLVKTQTAATGDHHSAIVEGIGRLCDALMGSGRRRVDLGWALHFQRRMWPLLVELFDEVVELGLLLQNVGASGTGGFLFEGEMHAFMTAILLRVAGLDAFEPNSQPEPPNAYETIT
jgi:hypothetical protein